MVLQAFLTLKIFTIKTCVTCYWKLPTAISNSNGCFILGSIRFVPGYACRSNGVFIKKGKQTYGNFMKKVLFSQTVIMYVLAPSYS